MRKSARRTRIGCWVDVFELPYFQGRMLRLHGPGDFDGVVAERGTWPAASMVVGPGAAVMCLWRAKTGQDDKWLRPRGTIADLSGPLEGGTLLSIRVMPKGQG